MLSDNTPSDNKDHPSRQRARSKRRARVWSSTANPYARSASLRLAMPSGDDSERHRREEAERKAKRKHAKSNKSDAQKEKERKRKEHAQRILRQQGGDAKKKKKPNPPSEEAKSLFQELFASRAQGFQIDFRFRNAPPRPPVGPCFVGSGLDGVLSEASKYKPLNAVEVNYHWRLHSEPDLGVPIAPSAVDPTSYTTDAAKYEPKELHPDDAALLDWKGSMGDTAAEELKRRRDRARAAARLALLGKSPAQAVAAARSQVPTGPTSKKAFSRVLREDMQSWMKKTTYLSNDYSRKVHDFKSLAQTKEDMEEELKKNQLDVLKQRSPQAIAGAFSHNTIPIRSHPKKKGLTPVSIMPVLPNAEHWGHSYTHVVIDKWPERVDAAKMQRAFVANVQRKEVNARMTCQLFVSDEGPDSSDGKFQAIQQYDLDVVPLKDEDVPHMNFSVWLDPSGKSASFLPISSRVQLSTGRPLKKKNFFMDISRRDATADELKEMNETAAEVDPLGHGGGGGGGGAKQSKAAGLRIAESDDDDSDQAEGFVNGGGTFVADEE